MLRKKMKKSIVAVMIMCMFLAQGSTYLAALNNLDLEVYEASKHKIYVIYTNAEPVSFLQMRLDYEEYDWRKGTTEEDFYTSTATGGCTAVSVLKENGGDISFTKAWVSVKVDNSWIINDAAITIE